MFETRLQTAQFWLAVSALLFMLGPIVVAVFCVLLAHGAATTGCFLYMDAKGYPAILGIPIGVGLGVMSSLLILMLPDQSEERPFNLEDELTREGVRNARRRNRG